MKTPGVLISIISVMIVGFAANTSWAGETQAAGPDKTILSPIYFESAFASSIYFDFETPVLTPIAVYLVEDLAKKYKEGQNREFILIGHADTAEENPDALSLQRAEAVRDAFTALGIDGFDISIEGWGTRGQPYPRGEGVREPLNRSVVVYSIKVSQ
jgi:outer membrane protein OmpA-like peptidoglycan-associated protein